jgi:hypothetical protein
MKTNLTRQSAHRRSRAAMTLVEMLVTAFLSTILFAALALLWVNGARSVLAMTNYTELDRTSKYALDVMSKDVRQAKTMTSYSTNSIAMTTSNGASLVAYSYTYNPTAKTLTRTYGGVSKVLLTSCDRLAFSIYQRTPTNNFAFTKTSVLNEAKLVDVNWKCSRQIRGQSVNTESIQTAKIVMRN